MSVGLYPYTAVYDAIGPQTPGNVLFWNSAGIIGSDNGFVFDNTNKRVGIGTTPSYRLDVQDTQSVGGTSNSNFYAARIASVFTATANSAFGSASVEVDNSVDPAGFTLTANKSGVEIVSRSIGTGSPGTLVGVHVTHVSTGGGAFSAIGVLSDGPTLTSGTLTSYHGFYARGPFPTATGTLAGFVSEIDAGGGRYNLNIVGTAQNYLAGGVTLGNSTIAVDGTLRFTGTDFEGYKAGAWGAIGGSTAQYWSREDLGSSTLTNGLIAYWHLEEASGSRLDAVGTHHLTPQGTVSTIVNAAGKIGNALSMNGTNGTYLSAPHDSVLTVGPNQDFSLAIWVWVNDTGANMGFVGKGAAVPSSAYMEYLLWQYSGNWRFEIGTGSTFISAVSSFAPVANTWCLLIGWYDATADMQYIQVNNGLPVGVANTTGSWNSGLPFEVGRTVGFASQSLNGRVDMPMFAKRIWTTLEREQMWNNGAGFAHPFVLPSRLSPAAAGDQILLAGSAVTIERLELSTGIKLGTSTGTIDGIMRWTGSDFEGRMGGVWKSFTSAGSPGGSDGQVQYNNSGVFGGSSVFIFDDTNGRVGIGVTPATKLDVLETLTLSPSQDVNTCNIVSTYTLGDGFSSIQGLNIEPTIDLNGKQMNFYSYVLNVFTRGRGSGQGSCAGMYIGASFDGTGSYSYTGVFIYAPYNNESATFSKYTGIEISQLFSTVSGNVRGIDMGINAATNRYNIYASGTAQNYLAGRLGIGVAVPTESLDVNGAIKIGAAVATGDGTIRYASNIFEGRQAGAWVPLGGGGDQPSRFMAGGF